MGCSVLERKWQINSISSQLLLDHTSFFHGKTCFQVMDCLVLEMKWQMNSNSSQLLLGQASSFHGQTRVLKKLLECTYVYMLSLD